MFNAHLKLRKYFDKGFSYINNEFKVKNSAKLKISIEGNEEVLSAVKFINAFDGEDDSNG